MLQHRTQEQPEQRLERYKQILLALHAKHEWLSSQQITPNDVPALLSLNVARLLSLSLQKVQLGQLVILDNNTVEYLEFIFYWINLIANPQEHAYLITQGFNLCPDPSRMIPRPHYIDPVVFHFMARFERLRHSDIKPLLMTTPDIDDDIKLLVFKDLIKNLLSIIHDDDDGYSRVIGTLVVDRLSCDDALLISPRTDLTNVMAPVRSDPRYSVIQLQRKFVDLIMELAREVDALTLLGTTSCPLAEASALSRLQLRLEYNCIVLYNPKADPQRLIALSQAIESDISEAKKALTTIRSKNIPKDQLIQAITKQKSALGELSGQIPIQHCLQSLMGFTPTRITRKLAYDNGQRKNDIDKQEEIQTDTKQRQQGFMLEHTLCLWYISHASNIGCSLTVKSDYHALLNAYHQNQQILKTMFEIRNFFERIQRQLETLDREQTIRAIRETLLGLLTDTIRTEINTISENLQQLQSICFEHRDSNPNINLLITIINFTIAHAEAWLTNIGTMELLSLDEDIVTHGGERLTQLENARSMLTQFLANSALQPVLTELCDIEKRLAEQEQTEHRLQAEMTACMIACKLDFKNIMGQFVAAKQLPYKDRSKDTAKDEKAVQALQANTEILRQKVEELEMFFTDEQLARPFDEWISALMAQLDAMYQETKLTQLQQLSLICQGLGRDPKICTLSADLSGVQAEKQTLTVHKQKIDITISRMLCGSEPQVFALLLSHDWLVISQDVATKAHDMIGSVTTELFENFKEHTATAEKILTELLRLYPAALVVHQCFTDHAHLQCLMHPCAPLSDESLLLSSSAREMLHRHLQITCTLIQEFTARLGCIQAQLKERSEGLSRIEDLNNKITHRTTEILDGLSHLQDQIDALCIQVNLEPEARILQGMQKLIQDTHALLASNASISINTSIEQIEQHAAQLLDRLKLLQNTNLDLEALTRTMQELGDKLPLRDQLNALQTQITAMVQTAQDNCLGLDLPNEDEWLGNAAHAITTVKETEIDVFDQLISRGNELSRSLQERLSPEHQIQALSSQIEDKMARIRELNPDQNLQLMQQWLNTPTVEVERIAHGKALLIQLGTIEQQLTAGLQQAYSAKKQELVTLHQQLAALQKNMCCLDKKHTDLQESAQNNPATMLRQFQEKLDHIKSILDSYKVQLAWVSPELALKDIIIKNPKKEDEDDFTWIQKISRLMDEQKAVLKKVNKASELHTLHALVVSYPEDFQQQQQQLVEALVQNEQDTSKLRQQETEFFQQMETLRAACMTLSQLLRIPADLPAQPVPFFEQQSVQAQLATATNGSNGDKRRHKPRMATIEEEPATEASNGSDGSSPPPSPTSS